MRSKVPEKEEQLGSLLAAGGTERLPQLAPAGSKRSAPQSAILDCPPLAERLPGDPSWGHSTPRQVTGCFLGSLYTWVPFHQTNRGVGEDGPDPH